jgi:gluconate kinase
MPADLVSSQFTALEPPEGEPSTLRVAAVHPVGDLIDEIEAWWTSAALR